MFRAFLRQFHRRHRLRHFYTDVHCSSNPFHNHLDALFDRCSTTRHLQQLHAAAIVSSSSETAFLSARLISSYSHFGRLLHSLSTFRSAAVTSGAAPLLWNSILRATLFHDRPHETISLYREMRSLAVIPDGFTFPLAVRASSLVADDGRMLGSLIHAQAIVLGYGFHLHVANELILFYSRIHRSSLARQLFDKMPHRNLLSWNSMISGFTSNFDCDGAMEIFRRMADSGLEPSPVTWTSVISAHARCLKHDKAIALFDEMRVSGSAASAEMVAVALSVCPYIHEQQLTKGEEIHCIAKKNGFKSYSFVRNSLISMYGKLRSRDDAERLFSEAAEAKDVVGWNALISSYAAAGLCFEAYNTFLLMLESREEVTPNLVTWSAVIGGFSSSGLPEPAMGIFRKMVRAGIAPNSVTVVTVLSSCADLSALSLGKEVHGHAFRARIDSNLPVANGLLHMYARSACLADAVSLFDKMKEKDLISWNTMISGYGSNGLCNEALGAFSGLLAAGLKPDGVTFVAVLSACAHAGRVSDGRRLLNVMENEHGLTPLTEHYACMVDLLGRAGQLQEAFELVQKMPTRPNACIWGALLNACRIHGNSVAASGEAAAVLGCETHGSAAGNHMLLSNIYAAAGNWEESARVRVVSTRKGLKKNPGKSWIELQKTVYAFSSGGGSGGGGFHGCLGAKEVDGVVSDLHMIMEDESVEFESSVELGMVIGDTFI